MNRPGANELLVRAALGDAFRERLREDFEGVAGEFDLSEEEREIARHTLAALSGHEPDSA